MLNKENYDKLINNIGFNALPFDEPVPDYNEINLCLVCLEDFLWEYTYYFSGFVNKAYLISIDPAKQPKFPVFFKYNAVLWTYLF